MDAFIAQLELLEQDCSEISDRSQNELYWQVFNEYRKIGKFIDLTLILPDKTEFKVHKIIMALVCPYFAAMFDYNERSRKTEVVNKQQEYDNDADTNNCGDDDNHGTNENIFDDAIVILDKEISAEIFENIINFIYTGDIKISPETALILHENATFFKLSRLKEICAAFLTKNFQIETCLECWKKSAFDDNLQENCFEFITRNCELFLERNILILTFEQLKKIVSCNKAVCPEERLYGFVIQWATNDYEHRSEQFKLLLEDLRFIALTKIDYLKFNINFNHLSNKELFLTVKNYFKEKTNFVTTKTNLTYQLIPPRIGFREKHFVAVTPKSIYNHELKTSWTLVNKHNFDEGFNVNTFGIIKNNRFYTICFNKL